MKKTCDKCLIIILLLKLLPMEGYAREIMIAVNSTEYIPDGYQAMVTAGIVGVMASAGLLIMSNHR